MSAAAQAAINTLFQIGDGASPEVWATVANVGDITGPGMSVNLVDVTSHSTGTPWREFLPTLLDGGKISFKLFYIPTDASHNNSAGLLSYFTGRAKKHAQLVFPDMAATKFTFYGFVIGLPVTATVAGVLEMSVDFQITGQPTLA